MMNLVTVNTEGAVAFHIGWRSFFPASVTSKWISPLSPHTDWNTVLWSSNPLQKHPVSSFQRSANSLAFSWNHKWDGTSLNFWMYSIGQKVHSGVLYLMGKSEQTFWPTHYFQTNVSLSPLSEWIFSLLLISKRNESITIQICKWIFIADLLRIVPHW